MTFVSYAQNYEDVMLRRALRDVRNGFYVDVGAQHPVTDSVTKAFYDMGWTGINVEPVPEWHQMLEEARPNDINLNVAAGNAPGMLHFYSIEGTGLSTADARLAESYRQERKVREFDVPVTTLSAALKEHAPSDIHFLKIDVEGFEKEVLEGADFSRFRPWVVLVEATRPLSPETTHEEWEQLLVENDYAFAYFDGLNRFYVAMERERLMAAFRAPPNYFDFFIRNSEREMREQAEKNLENSRAMLLQLRDGEQQLAEIRQRMEETLKRLDDAEARRTRAMIELEKTTSKCKVLEQQVIAMEGSLSWRITKPLRHVMKVIRRS